MLGVVVVPLSARRRSALSSSHMSTLGEVQPGVLAEQFAGGFVIRPYAPRLVVVGAFPIHRQYDRCFVMVDARQDGVSLVPEWRKPFDVLVEGLFVSSSRATGWLLNFSAKVRPVGLPTFGCK